MLQPNDLLPTNKIETGTYPTHTIIWMHGLGADGHDFIPIVRALNLHSDTHIRFIFPHAPMRSITVNNGHVMRAWYDIYHITLNLQEDEIGIRDSQKEIDNLIHHEILCGIKPENIILAGFSQGGVMALHNGLRNKNKLAGILALSCYLPLAKTLLAEVRPPNFSVPVFMAHGIRDHVIPIELAKTSRDFLIDVNCEIEWHEYAMEHAVCDEEVADISSWIEQIVKDSR